MNKDVFSACVLDPAALWERTVNSGVFRGYICERIRVITNALILKLAVAISHSNWVSQLKEREFCVEGAPRYLRAVIFN